MEAQRVFRGICPAIIAAASAILTATGITGAAPGAQAQPTISQDSLSNSPEAPYSPEDVAPTLKVHSSACITVQALVVNARDSKGDNVGWGGDFNNPTICPSGYTLTPNPRSFTTGVYIEFGAYLLNNVWTNFRRQVLNVTATQVEPSWDSRGTHTLTFDDEFNDTSIDTSKWNTDWWVGHPGDFMAACYDPSHDNVGFGVLAMTLTQQTCSYGGKTYSYDGAILNSYRLFSQSGGEFEASVALPCNASGQVYGWPAFWMVDNTWTGEIDHVEGGWPAAPNGGTPSHLEYTDNSGHFVNPGWQSSSPYCGWHTFGAQWNPPGQTVTFYWDGKAVFTHEFIDKGSKPEYLIFDYQMASRAISPPPSGVTMYVDWVRAWN
jgi:hypothetical protein